MQLNKIMLDNFRCFKHLELFFHTNHQSKTLEKTGGMTVLVAANGQGKTAVLEAVKYLLGSFISRFPKTSVPRLKDSDYRDEWSLREGLLESQFVKKPRAPYLRLWGEAEFSHAGDEPIQWDLFMKRDKTPRTSAQLPTFTGSKKINEQADWFIDRDNEEKQAPLPIIAYYNTERAVIRNKPERRRGFQKIFNRYDAYTGALDNGLNYKKTIEWFCFLEDKQRREKEVVQDWNYQTLEYRTIQLAVENMLPGFRNLRTTLGPLDLIVDIEEAEQSFKTCRIDTQLSDGYKIVLVLVLDLVSRILEANAGIPGVTPEQLLRAEGIVLIDEVDLHLHPSWQQRILGDLRRTFPCLQFIVSTHSPQVVSSVPKECVRIIDEGEVIPFDSQTQGVESQDILAQIFGTAPAPQEDPHVRLLKQYAEMAAHGLADSEEGRQVYQKLAEHFGVLYAPLLRIEIHRKFMAKKHGGENA